MSQYGILNDPKCEIDVTAAVSRAERIQYLIDRLAAQSGCRIENVIVLDHSGAEYRALFRDEFFKSVPVQAEPTRKQRNTGPRNRWGKLL